MAEGRTLMRIRLLAVASIWAVTATLTACSASGPADDPTTSPTPPSSQSGPGSVWVADEGGDSLTVIDASANSVVTTLTGISQPHNVQVGRDGATVYAVSGGTDSVVAIDAASYTVAAVAPTGSGPAHVIEAPNGKVYVSDADDGTVSVFQAPRLTPVGRIDVGGMPHGLRPAADGSVIVVANTAVDRLDLIDPSTDRSIGTVSVGKTPVQVAVTADGRYAYTGIAEPPSVVKVDLTSRTVVGSVAVPTMPVQLYLTPDEETVLSANQGTADNPGNTVSMIDTSTMAVSATANTGSGPHGVVIDTGGSRAWVTNTFGDTVSAFDVSDPSTVATIAVGKSPNGISFSPRPPASAAGPTVPLDLPNPGGAAEGGHGGH